MRRCAYLGVAISCLAACGQPEDPAREALRTRLKQEARLRPDEVRQWFDQIAPAITNQKVSVKEGALTRTLNDEQRTAVLGILADPGAVYDIGLKTEGKYTWRGIRTGGTSALSELDAFQTLWIDVDSFVPRRYEFEYSSSGFGDFAYDLTFTP